MKNNQILPFKPDCPIHLNRHDELAHGCVLFIPFWERVGVSRDVYANRAGTSIGTAGWGVGQYGRTKAWDGASSDYYPRDAAMEFPVGTWAAFVRRGGTLASYARPFGKTYSNGTAAPYLSWDFEYNPGGAGQNSVNCNAYVSGTLVTAGTVTLADTSIPHLVIGTFDGTNLVFYQNATNLYTRAASGVLQYDTSSAGNLVVGGSSSAAASVPWIGDIYWVAAWNRPFSLRDVLLLDANKWRLMGTYRRQVWPMLLSGTPLTGSGTATATSAATASISVPLVSAGIATASGSGVLNQAIPMTGSATAQATGNGDLHLSLPISGNAIAQALGAGTLQQAIAMLGGGTADATGSGAVSLSIALASQAIADAIGSGQLTVSGSLSGDGAATATGTGTLTQQIPLTGSSLAAANGQGNLIQIVNITGSGAAAAGGGGTLLLSVQMQASGLAQALAVGDMSLRLTLSGASVAQAVGSGALSQSQPNIHVSPGRLITGDFRARTITPTARTRTITGDYRLRTITS